MKKGRKQESSSILDCSEKDREVCPGDGGHCQYVASRTGHSELTVSNARREKAYCSHFFTFSFFVHFQKLPMIGLPCPTR